MGAEGFQPPRRVSRLFLSLLELQVPMVLGAFVCYLLGRAIQAESDLATSYRPGTYAFAIGDVLFLTVPVVAWMLFRDHGRRRTVEMALAMLAPVAVIAIVGELAGYPYLLWLVTGMYPAMSLGMTALLVCRRDRFTGPMKPGPPHRDRPAGRDSAKLGDRAYWHQRPGDDQPARSAWCGPRDGGTDRHGEHVASPARRQRRVIRLWP